MSETAELDARTASSDADIAELAAMEVDLAEVGGVRVTLQRRAREQLTAEGAPITRATVTHQARADVRRRGRSGGGLGMLTC